MCFDSITHASWPDLFRPSTSLFEAHPEDVDARDKRGHDEKLVIAWPKKARHCEGR
jgi:hypothetical protein